MFDPRVKLDPLWEFNDKWDDYYGYMATDNWGFKYYTSNYAEAVRWLNS